MCMKNLNVNVVFSEIVTNLENDDIQLSNINGKIGCVNSVGKRYIPKLSIATFFTGLEPKEGKKNTANNILDFEKTYQCAIRITETISGQFKDIDIFEFSPEKMAKNKELCMKVFNAIHFTIVENIELTPKASHERFVIKLLIREYDENRVKNDGWIVQTIIPIPLVGL